MAAWYATVFLQWRIYTIVDAWKPSESPKVGILAVIPLIMIVDSLFFHPKFYEYGSLGELAYPVIGVPILIFNFWAWEYPEIIEFYFLGKDKQTQ